MISTLLAGLIAFVLVSALLLVTNELADRGLFFLGKVQGYSLILLIIALAILAGVKMGQVLQGPATTASVQQVDSLESLKQIDIRVKRPDALTCSPKAQELLSKLKAYNTREVEGSRIRDAWTTVQTSAIYHNLEKDNREMEDTLAIRKARRSTLVKNAQLRAALGN